VGALAGSVVAVHVLLSVLDLAPVGVGSSPAAALQASLVLAREAERPGYTRYWVAEDHNMPGIASSSPPVLLYNFTPQEREVVKAWTGSHVVGSPETVLRQLAELVHRTDADELMITTMTHGPAARVRSYRLVAKAAELTPARGEGPLLEDRAVG
jgi:alkanesulfonate monooxygenase SsuD/methylene tetrahydromethanopterin reductase-like flavin-dependent oxidoreductase (luciferase family)